MKKIPFLDLKAQYDDIASDVQRELREVCDHCSFILGPKVEAFESAFAESVGAAHCVALNSGTSALHLAMCCLDVGHGDEIIVPAMTFIATAWGAMYNHAKVVLVDVDPATRTLDPAKLERAITPKTKAIIPVHLYGQPANMDAIMAIGCFSFYPGKNLGAYGEGGALVTNDAALAQRARTLRDHGQAQRYHHDEVGYNYRMDGFQGAVLGVKLKHLPEWSRHRRRVAARYGERLAPSAERGWIDIPREPAWSQGVFHLYVVLVKDRDRVKAELTEAGIGVGLHYPIPLHLQRCLARAGHSRGDFPVAERIGDQCLSLPMYPELADADVDYVVERLERALSHD
jgi:dTDP-4-amino-4,6-dideoxygalactose transaminase